MKSSAAFACLALAASLAAASCGGGGGGASPAGGGSVPGAASSAAPATLPDPIAARRVEAEPLLDKASVAAFLAKSAKDYHQKYTLSCEVALLRMSLAFMGIRRLTEDGILGDMPRAGVDPEKYFVCDDLMGKRTRPDGSIYWNNYGTHPPVIVEFAGKYMDEAGVADLYEVKEEKLSDAELKALAKDDPKFLGAIVWIVGHPKRWGYHPPVNERGMVLGEHVWFVGPSLDAKGRLVVWDPEPLPGQPYLLDEIPTRDMFQYRVVTIRAR